MTQSVMPEPLLKALKPEFVSPLVLYLCHESSSENGSIFEVGGGWVSKLRWERTKGSLFPINKQITPESVREKWNQITDFSQKTYPTSNQEAFAVVMSNLNNQNNSSTSEKPTDEVSSIFNMISQRISEQGSSLVGQIKGVYLFKVEDQYWTIDLKNGNGSVKKHNPIIQILRLL